VMGIINASPNSFSGPPPGDLDGQVEAALGLAEDGADLIDVGGESSVTVGPRVGADEEIRRVVPLIERLTARGLVVSVDTWKAKVARAALAAGAAMVNDVSGLSEPALAEACAEVGAGLVLLHTRASPKVREFPTYADLTADVAAFLEERMAEAVRRGVELEQLVLDPGPDFSKTPDQSVEILRALPGLHALGRPILLSVSRKDFVGAITGRRPRQRLAGTLAAVASGLDSGAAMVRVHDVAEVVDFLAVRAALDGLTEVSADPLADHLRHERPLPPDDHVDR
jgi:dihydropteroate synthase